MFATPKFPIGSYVRCAEASRCFYSSGVNTKPFVVGAHWHDGNQYAAYSLVNGQKDYGFWEKHLESCEGPW